MAIRLLHLADLHLGATGDLEGEHGAARRLDYQKAFDAAVDLAIERHTRVDAVLICGDLFDTHAPSAEQVALVQRQIDRLRDENIPVFLVPGLHDAYVYPDSVYRTTALSGVHLLLDADKNQPVTVELRSTPVHFYGCAWLSGRSGLSAGMIRRDLPGFHVALLHGDLQGAAESSPFRFEVSELEDTGVDYVAIGGRHTYMEMQTGGPIVAYCGSLEAVGPEDTEPGAFLVVLLDIQKGQHRVTLSRVPYASRPMVQQKVDVGSLQIQGGTAGLAGYLVRLADANAIMRIELVGSVEFVVDIERLHELLDNHFFHLDMQDDTRFFDAAIVKRIESENTVRGRYTRQLLAARSKGGAEGVMDQALKLLLKSCLEEDLL